MNEIFVEKINDFCSIVDREETHIIGIHAAINCESSLNDFDISTKYITNGTITFLAETLNVTSDEIISMRYNVHGDGNYSVIIGFAIDNLDNLPEFLPEHTVTFTIPANRYAKMIITGDRMQIDDYFIGEFRSASGYIFDISGYPMNTWNESGEILTKYEPIRKPADNNRFDTFELTPVVLPPYKIACCTHIHGNDEGSCIGDYFNVCDEVFKTGLTKYDQGDFYGFPIDFENTYKSCFGSRVSSFDGLPESVEKITLPGGLYVHVTQTEFNGDNPSMSYDVAFNHMDRLYFAEHNEYEFDHSRKVIARFRQANCASVFVPVKLK